MGCVLVALVVPNGQLRQPQVLVRELSGCEALRGCPKVFLLLSSAPGGEWLGRDPHCGAEQTESGGGWKAKTFPQPTLYFSTQLPPSPGPSSLA